jgi:sporulation protein YlmC with PRC-barrel domain
METYGRPYERRPRNRWLVPLLVIVGMAITLVVFADNDDKDDKHDKDAAAKKTMGTGTAMEARNPAAVPASYRGYKATKLLGSSVKNLEDKDLGKIEDLVINMNTGDVRYSVLSFGGLLGVGDDWYAIPVRELRPDADDDDLIVNLDRSRLENSKKFAKDTWPTEKGYWDDADKVYGIAPAAPPSAQPSKNPTAFRAKDLIGKDVRSLEEKTGTIKDLVVDMNGQKVKYVVLERDKAYGGSLVAVPLSSFLVSADNRDLVLTVDGAKLRGLHGYDVDKWPDPNDRDALSAIERDWNDTLHGTAKPN